MRLVAILLAVFFGTGALAQDTPSGFADAAASALKAYPSAGLAVVRIENGEVAWSGYAGEQAPGVPASASTLFNTASIAKTVTAELVLRLAEAGKLSLHEPVASEYVHPDLADDPRYELLTPAILLSHQAGLKNWPYNYEDGRLAFIQDPGTGFTYSGAGYEILAEFAARRMNADFAELVEDWVLRPAGVENDVSLGAAGAPADRLAMPMQRGEAVYEPIGDAEMPPSAADNLFVTAPAYARLLIAMMEETPLTGEAADARSTSVLDTSDHAPCTMDDTSQCPIEAGQSLGWSVAGFEKSRYVFHGGSDWGENAIAIYDLTSHDGWVIFVNGGNGMGVWLTLMQAVAPENEYFRFVRSLPQVQQLLAALRSE
ncbi:serine hydrolase domain-containing protein [Pelagibacterium halotolerans]|uniref:serine hydrolase domain-containing protein n=1 Tax=Pelagibacterium halotolerans TaxID=531813 RepID=UPI00384BFF37